MHVGQAVQLVGALVVADLAEQVGHAPVLAVLGGVSTGVGLGLQLGVLGARPRRDQDRTVPPHPRPPQLAVEALRDLLESQAGERLAAREGWQDTGLVFTTHRGAALDAGNVRKMFSVERRYNEPS